MELENYFPDEDISNAKKIITPFHDKLLLDKKIDNPHALILVCYMISNLEKKGDVEKDKIKDLFIRFGRTDTEFGKAIYEISGKRKRKKGKREAWIEDKGNLIGLNIEGLKQVKRILSRDEKNE